MTRIIFILLACFVIDKVSAKERPPCGQEIDTLIRHGDQIVFAKTDSALVLFDTALEKATACGDSLGITKSVNFIGLCNHLKSNYDVATGYYFEALGIAERNAYPKDQGIINNNLGALYFDIQEYTKSKNYYEAALQIMTQLNDTSWLSRIHGNLAGVYFMNQEFDKSIKTLNTSIDFAIASEKYSAVGGALANLAMVHTSLGNIDEAVTSYDRGIYLLDSVGDYRGACIALIEKGKMQNQQKRYGEAQITLKHALEKALEVNHKESIMKSYGALSRNAESLGNIKIALEFQRQHTNWKDSLLTEEKFASIEELNKKYQTEKKEKEIAYLTSESELKSMLVEKKQRERNYLFLLAVLFLVVIVLIVIQLKQKQKLNSELVLKNGVIENSLKEREVLIREVHHRVKNNLQIVSSMLNIQANSLSDKTAKEAILESRKRVQSMSIVHQKLYKTDSVGSVDIKDYLEHILAEIDQFYDFEGDQGVEIRSSIESFSLSIDATIPLGLIINELVSNAYKHAFLNMEKGIISVELTKNGNTCNLNISDNGKGMDAPPAPTSFGIKLIKSLSKSLSTEVIWVNNNGTQASMSFEV